MDCAKVGGLIRQLRLEKGLTQKELAASLGLDGTTVSKWERGLGCPDVTLLSALSDVLGIGIENILQGDLSQNALVGGNMKNTKYYVCPDCGSLTCCTGDAAVSCCGRKLEALIPQKAAPGERLTVELVEDEWYITGTHPMTKEHYISFVAFATGEKLQIVKQYPEWNLQLRLPRRGHGTLLWYCTEHGLFSQLL